MQSLVAGLGHRPNRRADPVAGRKLDHVVGFEVLDIVARRGNVRLRSDRTVRSLFVSSRDFWRCWGASQLDLWR